MESQVECHNWNFNILNRNFSVLINIQFLYNNRIFNFGFYLKLRLKSPFVTLKIKEIGNKKKVYLIDMKARFCFRCGREFNRMESFCPSCDLGRRSILVSNPHDHKDAEELIKYYFNNGTQYKMIVLLLKEYHNIP